MFRVGVIGAGYMGMHYANVFSNRIDWNVVGVVARTARRASAFSQSVGGCPVFRSAKELYAATAPDLVVVCVPELQTPKVLADVWKFPWTVLVEKPAGHTLKVAKALRNQAQSALGETFLALNRRYYEGVRAALSGLVDEDRPRYLRLIDQHDTNAAQASGQPPDVVANWHHANAIHTVDLLRFFSRGAVRNVESSYWHGRSGDYVVEAQVEFASGDRACYSSYWNTPNTWHLSVNTPDVRFVLDPLEFAYKQAAGSRELEELETEGLDRIFKPGLSGLVNDLTHQLRGLSHGLPDLQVGVESMKLIQDIFHESAGSL